MAKPKSIQMPGPDFFQKEAQFHLVEGDLFSYRNPVIPIMTKGRAYGSLSQKVAALGVSLPELALNTARFVNQYIFVALWDDNSTYTPEGIFDCAVSCLGQASQNDIAQLVMPILGGEEGYKYLWAAERGIFEQSDNLDEMGLFIPSHIYVTNKKLA
jgi:hypothetical protein